MGADSDRAIDVMKKLYAHFSRNRDKFNLMGVRDAEMTKYAANSLLATKISFMNEIAFLCERLDVDVENVRRGIGSDSRIGYSFIYPGCGYGGSCFPKDIKALISAAETCDFEPLVLQAVERRNNLQKNRLFEKNYRKIWWGSPWVFLRGLGVSHSNLEQMICARLPSVVLINALIGAGAKVRAYDPVAMDESRHVFPSVYFDSGKLLLSDHQYDALKDVNAMVLVTEWKPFRQPDFAAMKRMMKEAVIFDGRNQYELEELENLGFFYSCIGKISTGQKSMAV